MSPVLTALKAGSVTVGDIDPLDVRLNEALARFYEDPGEDARINLAFEIFSLGWAEDYVAGALSLIGCKLSIEGVEIDADTLLDTLAEWLAANS